MSYVIIRPGIHNPEVERVEFDPRINLTVTIHMKDGSTYTVQAKKGYLNNHHYEADISSLPHLSEPMPPRPVPKPVTPSIDNIQVWKRGLEANDFQEMKSKIAQEITRQIEQQHLEADINGNLTSDHETVLGEISKWLP